MNKIIIIGGDFTEEPCEYCGIPSELRPYGKGGAKICYECGMKPENILMTDAMYTYFLNVPEVKEDQKN